MKTNIRSKIIPMGTGKFHFIYFYKNEISSTLSVIRPSLVEQLYGSSNGLFNILNIRKRPPKAIANLELAFGIQKNEERKFNTKIPYK